MNPKLSFWTGLGCTVLVTIGQSIALAGGRPGGQFSGGMKAKAPQAVHRPVPAQQTTSLGRHTGLQPVKTQVISGTLSSSSSARRLPGGTLGGSIPGKIPSGGLTPLSGTIVKQSTGAGIGARIKPGPPIPGTVKPPIGSGPFPPIVGGGTSSGGGGTTPPSGGGTTPPSGGGTTTPPAGGGTTPPSGGGTTPPSGGSTHPAHNHCHTHFPNWWWVTPALYPRCGTVYSGYYSPSYSVSSAPVIVSTPTIIALEDSVAVTAERLTLQLGESYSLKNENFGEEAGQIVLELNGLMLPALVTSWDAQTIAFTLPNLGLIQSSDGVLQVLKADQSVVKSVAVNVIAAQK